MSSRFSWYDRWLFFRAVADYIPLVHYCTLCPISGATLLEIASSRQWITINFNKKFFQKNHQFTTQSYFICYRTLSWIIYITSHIPQIKECCGISRDIYAYALFQSSKFFSNNSNTMFFKIVQGSSKWRHCFILEYSHLPQ